MTGIACMLLLGTASAGTKYSVTMQPCSYDDPMKPGRPMGREMNRMPKVFLDDNRLFFDTRDSPIIIYVYSGDRAIYAQMISVDSDSLELPGDLQGEFTLYMVYGETVYFGEINLLKIEE